MSASPLGPQHEERELGPIPPQVQEGEQACEEEDGGEGEEVESQKAPHL